MRSLAVLLKIISYYILNAIQEKGMFVLFLNGIQVE
jgi:hypothetical protein